PDEHPHERRKNHDDVGDDRRERSGNDIVDIVDVVAHAIHDLAGFRTGEERNRHAVHVRNEIRTDVPHDPFTDDRVYISLTDVECTDCDCSAETDPDVDGEFAHAP